MGRSEQVLIDRIAALESELAALKPRLAVRQTDTDCAIAIRALISEGYNDGDIECVIRAHVASETEPWRKRCEELERGEYICRKCGIRKDSDHDTAGAF